MKGHAREKKKIGSLLAGVNHTDEGILRLLLV